MTEESYVKMAESLEGNWYAVSFMEKNFKVNQLTGAETGAMLLDLYKEVRERKSISGKFPHTYVRDREMPVFIKLYDPKKCGGSCSTVAPDPWWIFSQVEPTHDELTFLLKNKK